MLDYAFHVLQLRNVLLETLEWNAAGLAAYERAGFRRIGVRRGARISRGQPTDIVLMDAVPQYSGASGAALSTRGLTFVSRGDEFGRMRESQESC